MNLALGPLCAACAAPAPSGWRRWYKVVYSRCMPYSLQGLLIQLEASIIIANKQQSVIIQWLYILSCLEARLHKQVYLIHRPSLKYHISSYNFRPWIVSAHVLWPLALCIVTLGFPNSKKNSFCRIYIRKYGNQKSQILADLKTGSWIWTAVWCSAISAAV